MLWSRDQGHVAVHAYQGPSLYPEAPYGITDLIYTYILNNMTIQLPQLLTDWLCENILLPGNRLSRCSIFSWLLNVLVSAVQQ